jgi:hypothetical protein
MNHRSRQGCSKITASLGRLHSAVAHQLHCGRDFRSRFATAGKRELSTRNLSRPKRLPQPGQSYSPRDRVQERALLPAFSPNGQTNRNPGRRRLRSYPEGWEATSEQPAIPEPIKACAPTGAISCNQQRTRVEPRCSAPLFSPSECDGPGNLSDQMN